MLNSIELFNNLEARFCYRRESHANANKESDSLCQLTHWDQVIGL